MVQVPACGEGENRGARGCPHRTYRAQPTNQGNHQLEPTRGLLQVIWAIAGCWVLLSGFSIRSFPGWVSGRVSACTAPSLVHAMGTLCACQHVASLRESLELHLWVKERS